MQFLSNHFGNGATASKISGFYDTEYHNVVVNMINKTTDSTPANQEKVTLIEDVKGGNLHELQRLFKVAADEKKIAIVAGIAALVVIVASIILLGFDFKTSGAMIGVVGGVLLGYTVGKINSYRSNCKEAALVAAKVVIHQQKWVTKIDEHNVVEINVIKCKIKADHYFANYSRKQKTKTDESESKDHDNDTGLHDSVLKLGTYQLTVDEFIANIAMAVHIQLTGGNAFNPSSTATPATPLRPPGSSSASGGGGGTGAAGGGVGGAGGSASSPSPFDRNPFVDMATPGSAKKKDGQDGQK